MPSTSLASKVDRSIRHVRWLDSGDGWGGDDEVTLTVLNADIPGRIEWVEGPGIGWNVWIFIEDADIQALDIFLLDDLELALRVDRVGQFTWLSSGLFHHYEVLLSEHEKGYDDLVAAIP